MNLTNSQKRALIVRRLKRVFAVWIYSPFGRTTPNELDSEFQHGLEAGFDVKEWHQELALMRIGDSQHMHTKRNESLLRNWHNDTCLACLQPWFGPPDGGETA